MSIVSKLCPRCQTEHSRFAPCREGIFLTEDQIPISQYEALRIENEDLRKENERLKKTLEAKDFLLNAFAESYLKSRAL